MSLQVWLPLNGDLRNLGVSNITVTNDGATIDNNGKIGKCYSFNGTNNKIIIDNFSVGNEWSYGCWLYSATSTRGWEGVIILNTNGGDSDMQLGLYTNPAGNRIQNTANGQYNSGIAFTYGQWNHFFGTFDGSSLKTYINGVLVNTKAITNGILSRSKLTIGARCRGSSYDTFFQGKINDFRIYDHVLSAAEVREISQGLVLHYKLDDGVTATSGNLVGNARYGQTAAAGSTWGAHRYYSTQVDLDASAPVPWKKGTKFQLVYDTSLGSGGGGSCSLGRFAAEPSTTYCYSLYINAPDDMAYIHANWMYRYEYEAAYNATAGTRIIEQGVAAKARAENLGNHWYRIWGTFTTNASTHSITFSFFTYPGKSITYYIACPQIEKGTTMTAWSGELGARRIYEDSSGYGHHGLVTGDLSSSDNSARYNNCIYMPNGQTDYITSQDNVGYFTNGITLNIWFKSTNKSPGSGYHHCFNSLSQWVYIEMAVHQNGYLRCGLYINGTRYVNNTNNTNLLDGNWHMLTMTYDGASVKRYVDGVLKDTQAASGNLNTSSDKFIFGHGAATSYYCKETYLSDVRLYVTGLSADDVLELYHTGAKVDNKQNLHTFEINELSSNIFRSELIMPWAKPNRTRIGEIVEHNGYMALNIAPEPFYNNISSTTGGALDGMFQAGSYVFDIWVDVDSVISGGTNRAGGMVIRYSDNTTENAFVFTGGNLGYQHKIYITPANKTVQRLEFYYYTSTDVFYRIDSCIYPINETKFFKQGIVQSGGFLEDTKTRIIKNSLIETNEIIEL